MEAAKSRLLIKENEGMEYSEVIPAVSLGRGDKIPQRHGGSQPKVCKCFISYLRPWFQKTTHLILLPEPSNMNMQHPK